MMKKRTALFAGTALLSLAAATALYAPATGVTTDNFFTAGVCASNFNTATAAKVGAVYAGTDSFGGLVPADIDRIDPDADPKTATQAINNVGIVIDGATPNGAGTDLDAKARVVGALINSTVADSIATKLYSASELIDGSRALSDNDGLRLSGKLTTANNRIGTQGGNIISRINSAVGLIDAALDAETATLNKAIANIIGGAAADSANGVIGTDAAPNGSGDIDGAVGMAAKLRVVQSLISTGDNPEATSVAEALIDVQGNGTGGIIGNTMDLDDTAADYVNLGILAQLTAARNLIDATDGQDTIDNAIRAVQGAPGVPAGSIIGTDDAGDGTIDAATSIATKLQAFMAKLSQELTTAAAGGGGGKTVTYVAPDPLNLAGIEAALQIV